MGIGSHKVFKVVVNDISQELPILGESGSEVSYFIPEPRNSAEATRLSEDTNKPCLKATLKNINNLINKNIVSVQDPDKGEPVTIFMNAYKEKSQSDTILENLKLRIVVRGYLQNKDLIGDNWYPTASTRTLK